MQLWAPNPDDLEEIFITQAGAADLENGSGGGGGSTEKERKGGRPNSYQRQINPEEKIFIYELKGHIWVGENPKNGAEEHQVSKLDLAEKIITGKIKIRKDIGFNWENVSLTVGLAAGTFWMAAERLIVRGPAMSLAIGMVGFVTHFLGDIVRYRYQYGEMPDSKACEQMLGNGSQIFFKLFASSSGWMAGDWISGSAKGFKKILSVALGDAIATPLANMMLTAVLRQKQMSADELLKVLNLPASGKKEGNQYLSLDNLKLALSCLVGGGLWNVVEQYCKISGQSLINGVAVAGGFWAPARMVDAVESCLTNKKASDGTLRRRMFNVAKE